MTGKKLGKKTSQRRATIATNCYRERAAVALNDPRIGSAADRLIPRRADGESRRFYGVEWKGQNRARKQRIVEKQQRRRLVRSTGSRWIFFHMKAVSK